MLRLIRWSVWCFLIAVAIVPQPLSAQDASAVLSGHLDAVTMGRFTPDGRSVVTVSFDHTARLWDVATRSERQQYAQHTGPLYCLAVSGDGTTMVTGAQDNTLRIWDLPLADPLRVIANTPTKRVHAISLSPSGKELLSASHDHILRVDSTDETDRHPSNQAGVSSWSGHAADVLAVTYRNDGAMFASSDAAGRILLWSPFLNEPQGELIGHSGGVTHLGFVSNNQQLLSAGDDGILRVWQIPDPPQSFNLGEVSLIDWSMNLSQSQAVCIANANRAFVLDLNTAEMVTEYPKLAAQPTAVAHASNNSWVCIADQTGAVQLLNYNDGVVRGTVSAHPTRINAVAIHPDATRFATAAEDGSVRFWTQPSKSEEPHQPLRQWQIEANAAPTSLTFTLDQQHLLCGATDGRIRQWNLSSGELVRTIDAHQGAVRKLVVAPNAQTFGSCGKDKTLKLWSLGDGTAQQTLQSTEEVHSFGFSADSIRVAAAYQDGVVRVWERASGQLLQSLAGHTAAVVAVGYLSDGQTIVSASHDQTLRRAKASTTAAWPLHESSIRGMALYAGGAQVLTCNDQSVVLSNTSNGQPVRAYRVAELPSEPTGDGAAEPAFQAMKPLVVVARSDNQRVAAGTEAGEVLVWNSNAGDTPILTLQVGSPVISLDYSPDNQKLAVATAANTVHVFGPSTAGTQPAIELTEHQQFSTDTTVAQLLFSKDSQTIWTSLDNGRIEQWKYAGISQRFQLNHGGPIYGVAISNDGRLAVSCSADQTVRVWDATTGRQTSQLNGHSGAVHAIAISQDETFAVSSGADGTLRLWDIVGGRQLKQLARFDDTMYSIAIHPNGNRIAAAGADRKVHLLDMISGQELNTLEGHSDYIHCVAFDPSGERLMSYGYAGHLKLWNVADGTLLHQSRVGKVGNYAQFSSDGKNILLSNGDGTARVLPTPSN